jgi:hypothetical protein
MTDTTPFQFAFNKICNSSLNTFFQHFIWRMTREKLNVECTLSKKCLDFFPPLSQSKLKTKQLSFFVYCNGVLEYFEKKENATSPKYYFYGKKSFSSPKCLS